MEERLQGEKGKTEPDITACTGEGCLMLFDPAYESRSLVSKRCHCCQPVEVRVTPSLSQ